MDATDRQLASVGYQKMTIDDLALEVGIGKGSIYLHFSSKEEIALSHIDRIVDRLKSRLRTLAEEGGSYESRLRRMLVDRVLFRFDSVQHYTQSLNDLLAAIRPNLLIRRARYFADEAAIFAQVIERGVEQNEFGIGNAAARAESLIIATNSLLPYSLTARELGERHELEAKIVNLADLLLFGLRRRNADRIDQ